MTYIERREGQVPAIFVKPAGRARAVHREFALTTPGGASLGPGNDLGMTDERGTEMESGPAIFAGAAFALFGAALLLWTGVRVLHREPVAYGVAPGAAAALTTLFGAAFLLLGVWCFGRL